MSRLLIVQPLAVAAIAASRGTGVANLLTPEPKEVWADGAVGTAATLTIDLGAARAVDTILLGYLRPPAATATWSITGGAASSTEATIQATTTLAAPGAPTGARAHALWHGAVRTVRHLAINVTQPTGSPPLTAGLLVIGDALVAELGPEWGLGRKVIDTGTATPLPSGGFAVVEGARKRRFNWTFGDLSADEVERIEQVALALGETGLGLVVEDSAATAWRHAGIHPGLFRWNAWERKNRRQSRWEIGIEEWV